MFILIPHNISLRPFCVYNNLIIVVVYFLSLFNIKYMLIWYPNMLKWCNTMNTYAEIWNVCYYYSSKAGWGDSQLTTTLECDSYKWGSYKLHQSIYNNNIAFRIMHTSQAMQVLCFFLTPHKAEITFLKRQWNAERAVHRASTLKGFTKHSLFRQYRE